MTSSLVKAAPPSEGFKHPQNGAAVRYLEEPPGVGSTRGEGTLAPSPGSAGYSPDFAGDRRPAGGGGESLAPVEQADCAQGGEDRVEDCRQQQAFVDVEADVDDVDGDPDPPALQQLAAGHEERDQARDGGEGVGDGRRVLG